jgi:hypothetical protein
MEFNVNIISCEFSDVPLFFSISGGIEIAGEMNVLEIFNLDQPNDKCAPD